MLIMVLPDGETFAGVDGCTIYEVPEDLEIEEIERLLKEESRVLKDICQIREQDGLVVAFRKQ